MLALAFHVLAAAHLCHSTADDEHGFVLVASQPRIFRARGFLQNLTDHDVDELFGLAYKEAHVQGSSVSDGDASLVRRSKSIFLNVEITRKSEIAKTIRTKLAQEMKLSAAHFEFLSLVDYKDEANQPGFYGPHIDGLGRLATLIVFLTEHGEGCGGETFFPFVDSQGRPKKTPLDMHNADVAAPWRVLEWPAILCEAHGSDLDMLRFRPRRGDAILFYHKPVHAKRQDDSENRAFHGGCPLKSNDCGLRRIAQQFVRYEWSSPREDGSTEISLKRFTGADTSPRGLQLAWHEDQACRDDAEGTCSAQAADVLSCTPLDAGAAARMRVSGGSTIVLSAPCAHKSPFQPHGVLQLRMGLARWQVVVKGDPVKGGCKVSANFLDSNVAWGEGRTEKKEVSIDISGDKLWSTIALISESQTKGQLISRLVTDSTNGKRRKKTFNRISPWPDSNGPRSDGADYDAKVAADGGVALCVGPGAMLRTTMLRDVSIWSRSFDAYEEGKLWKWMKDTF